MMNSLRTCLFLLPLLVGRISPLTAQHVSRHWSGIAAVVNNKSNKGADVPVRLDLGAPAKDGRITGAFVNGPERSPSSSGTLHGNHLVLQFRSFARTLEGDIQGNTLRATFSGARMKPWPMVLRVDRDGKPRTTFVARPRGAAGASIDGDWEVAGTSSKGEAAWTLHVEPYAGDGEIRAVFQHIDGDSGSLYGRFDEATGEYRVSSFSDAGATIYALKPQAGGTLQVVNLRDTDETNVARRPAEARKENLPPPTASTDQTTLANPKEPLRFSGPNLAGTTISSTDEQFRGKVVIVTLSGSWCPNCHDEAPFLVHLYNTFHQRGLEIVDLSFEEGDQLKNPDRLRAFVTKYNIPYPVLLMGTPDEVNERLPQAQNLNSWPTTFFIGRYGLVKEIHAGFSGPATGEANVKLKADVTALVERLLAAKTPAQ